MGRILHEPRFLVNGQNREKGSFPYSGEAGEGKNVLKRIFAFLKGPGWPIVAQPARIQQRSPEASRTAKEVRMIELAKRAMAL